MAIVYQHDKRCGITYAYESYSSWDNEAKKKRFKRKLIGRVDPDTGEIVPTDGRRRHKQGKIKKASDNDPDYKVLYEKLELKCASQEILIKSLQKEISKLNREG